MQVQGAVSLYTNMISEVSTGEGKTLSAAMAAYLRALEGKGFHVVTVNDCLAKRDADSMGEDYNIDEEMDSIALSEVLTR